MHKLIGNLKISHRLKLGFGFMLALMVGLTMIAHQVSRNLREQLNATINQSNIKSAVASSMRHALIRQGILARGVGTASTADEMRAEFDAITAERSTYRESEGKLLASPLAPEEKQLLGEMERYDREVLPLLSNAARQLAMLAPGDVIRDLMRELLPIHIKWLGAIDQLVEQQNHAIRDQLRRFDELSDETDVWMATICGMALAAAVAISWLITRSVSRPVRQLIAFSRLVAAGDLSTRTGQAGKNEIALLAEAMDGMAESLESSQAQLISAARIAGMAEIATNVLHNVGSVLNSVNISAGLVAYKVRSSKAPGLRKAVALMDAHAGDLGEFFSSDPKGRLLPSYFRELARALDQEQAAMMAELESLSKSVDHIKHVIAAQQSYAGTTKVLEPLRVEDLVDDAVRINSEALDRHGIRIDKAFAEMPVLLFDRHRLLQILVNLIGNAEQAIEAARPEKPVITVSAEVIDGAVLRLTVTDNGVGIRAEDLARVFAHGFTTKANGHGFGLHSCISSAREMGGSMVAISEGVGKGAAFRLELPVV